MTGSAAPPGSGENTLTVSQSSGSAPGATGAEGASRSPDCGGGGPNMAASRTPSQALAGCGAANRRAPTGGWANGMPRKTATPFSTRPRTCPAAVRTTGSVTSIRTPSRAMSRKSSGCGPLWPPGRTLRHRVEQDDWNFARRGVLLIICEMGHAFLLRGPDRGALVARGYPGPGPDGGRADLKGDVRADDQVAEPLRVARLPAGRGEDGVTAPDLKVDERVDPFGTRLGPGVVQQQQWLPLEEPPDLPVVRTEFRDDLAVEVVAIRHGLAPFRSFMIFQPRS